MQVDDENKGHDLKQLVIDYLGRYDTYTGVRRAVYILSKRRTELNDILVEYTLKFLFDSSYNSKYYEVFIKICKSKNVYIDVNSEWIQSVNLKYHQNKQILEDRLEADKKTLKRELIYSSIVKNAELCRKRGLFTEAILQLFPATEYASNENEELLVLWDIVLLSIESETMLNCVPTCNRGLKLDYILKYPAYIYRFSAALAIHSLKNGSFVQCRDFFMGCISVSTLESLPFASLQELSMYMGVVFLATISRNNLKDLYSNNSPFLEMMKYCPWVKRCIHLYLNSDYKSCLFQLDFRKPIAELDFLLGPLYIDLLARINNKCLIDFISVYSSLRIDRISEAFGASPLQLEAQLVSLIKEGKIKNRIDSVEGILYIKRNNPRYSTYKAIEELIQKRILETKVNLLHVNMLKNKLFVGSEEDIQTDEPSFSPDLDYFQDMKSS